MEIAARVVIGMGDAALDLLPLANKIIAATAIDVLSDQTAVTLFREALVREIAGYSDDDAIEILEGTKFRTAIFPLQVEDGRVLEAINPIWTDPNFISPLVLSLAEVFDACISPSGHASFVADVSRHKETLAGLRLDSISVPDQTRFDTDVYALMVAGAAKSFLTDPDGRAFAIWAAGAK